jgi:hypothetical protein
MILILYHRRKKTLSWQWSPCLVSAFGGCYPWNTGRGSLMKQVAYRKNDLAHNRGRAISIRENVADKESDTRIVKNFVYLVTRVDSVPAQTPSPEIRILKKIDTERHREGFVFKVKGVIYIKKNRFIFQIRYGHSLNIQILWKTHVLAPGKPVVA